MSNVAVRLRVRRPGPGRVELREGGGAPGLFGVPFLGFGILALLATAGVVAMEAPEGPAGGLVLPAMAVIFTGVGVWFTLGRSWSLADGARRTLTRRFGLLVPMWTRVHRLDEFTAVRLSLGRGEDADSRDLYRVTLRRSQSKELPVGSSTDYGSARSAAEALAEVAGLPLEDASTGCTTVISPGELGRGPEALGDDVPALPARPAGLRTEVQPAGAGVRLRIPHRRSGILGVAAPLVVSVALASMLGPAALEFFRTPGAPRPLRWVQGALFLLVLGVPLLTLLRSTRPRVTELLASGAGLEVRERPGLRRRTTRVAARDLLGLDCMTGEDLARAARSATVSRLPGRPPSALGRWLGAGLGGIAIKHRGGILKVAEGLPDEELRYLYALLRRALSNRG